MKPTNDKVFLDTNIVIYAYSSTEEAKQQTSRRIMKTNHTVISTQALQSGCKLLYSEDLQHGQVVENQLTILNPYR
ncbi:MAG: hypothetical protein LBN37_02865 [Bacteroidales bacterium]|jgi:predicted nucleic acid-binding protein|nr:hypothetical protein [Bacteroidales bacterium]